MEFPVLTSGRKTQPEAKTGSFYLLLFVFVREVAHSEMQTGRALNFLLRKSHAMNKK